MASRQSKVKNKNAAPVQITAEQILREAKERQEKPILAPKQRVHDFDELQEYRLRKRKQFEEGVRRNRAQISFWLKYAAWEESQHEHERARSVFERALEVDHRSPTLWIKYAEMEMKHKNVNHARNIFDRAVTVLPRVDEFWYKYVWMEELLGNIAGARQVFERWMAWEPDETAWMAYIKLERKYNELDRARKIFEKFVSTHPQPKNWIKWARFEEEISNVLKARAVYEACIATLGEDFIDQNTFVSFAKFETRQKELERARAIYKYSLEKLGKEKAINLYKEYVLFEKQFGDREGIEDVVATKRRQQYEQDLAQNPHNYDTWFEYIRLEESMGDVNRTREVCERAIAQVPLVQEKRLWRRYIYLWLFYAIFEESTAKDLTRARQIYESAIKLVPHKQFTFAKLWLLYAKFLIRQMDLPSCRKTLGTALGLCPKEKLFKGYIELELELREFDRVRTLYEKYLEWNPANCFAWIKYAELEKLLGDVDRCRGIYEIAVSQPLLDMPEYLWKSYIDFEVEETEYENARALYKRLLDRTDHVKVWIAYAKFEFVNTLNGEQVSERLDAARKVFETAYKTLRTNRPDAKEERVVLLEAWKVFEQENGDEKSVESVTKRLPKAIKRRRKVVDEATGVELNQWEEYYDYLFPDEETQKPSLKLLQLAHQWKKSQEKGDGDA